MAAGVSDHPCFSTVYYYCTVLKNYNLFPTFYEQQFSYSVGDINIHMLS